ncbi:hypothetical protein RHGRI_035233 [Rhododendron griersonianum]|uniref:Photolyase/cryptochrome alpha/beta domain-containing protein n=1 Tax=Rhododendron griersonianum TaxID=479676 RepID=A0AAV6I4C6_9ERIC|nr:hypothetical protein RHGRI_035233 [Rhododendron griersonianum]
MRPSLSLSTPHSSFLRFTALSPTPPMASGSNSLVWFRKGIRIHDNPALEYAAKGSSYLYPVFVIDPRYMEPDPTAFSPGSARAGVNRIRFLLESLADLDSSLRKLGSRLLVAKGEPGEVLFRCLKEWDIKRLCFEYDTEPYYQALDIKVKNYASAAGIEVFSPVSHTLFNPADIIQKVCVVSVYALLDIEIICGTDKVSLSDDMYGCFDETSEKNSGRPPLSYQSFLKIAGQPSWASSPLSTTISSLPPVGTVENCGISNVPTLQELGYEDSGQDELTPFRGGESEALKRLRGAMDDKEWVAKFEKPKGDPSAFLRPATTVLSPYLKDVQKNVKSHTLPPVSLLGQLLWRDFFYTAAFGTPNFDRMNGNRICKQIPWNVDDELLAAWRDARTGFPWIDAIMVQLNCGVKASEMGLDASSSTALCCMLFNSWRSDHESPYELRVHEWLMTQFDKIVTCSSSTQTFLNLILPPCLTLFGCVPVVSHDTASKECKNKLAEAYELNKTRNGAVNEEDLKILRRKFEENQSQEPKSKRLKNKS